MATARVLTEREHPVRILDAAGNVDPFSVEISKTGGEHVKWFAHQKHGSTISFDSPDGSPFDQSTFQVGPGGSVPSGGIRPDAEPKEYNYTVVSENGVNDPRVIIRP